MTHRERFLATLLGRSVDRPPFYLFWGPWGTTWRRWRSEGMPPELTDWAAVRRHFGADLPPFSIPIKAGPCPRFPRQVFEETTDHVVHTDSWGIVRRDLKGRESMSDFLAFPVKSRDDWQRYKREHLDPHHPDRLAGPWREQCRQAVAEGRPLQLGDFPDIGLYGGLRWLLGDEDCLLAFHDDPNLVHEIMDHLTTVYLAVFEGVCREFPIDVIHLWEDMASRNGPLISPAHFNEFMAPNYRRITAFAREHGIPVISVDTDGQPELLIGPMLAGGINHMYPFEVAAGCDVATLRRRYPTLGMMGGIDKRVLAHGPAAIDVELARIAPTIGAGRYIPELDHLIPDDVSWANFSYYASALRGIVHSKSRPFGPPL